MLLKHNSSKKSRHGRSTHNWSRGHRPPRNTWYSKRVRVFAHRKNDRFWSPIRIPWQNHEIGKDLPEILKNEIINLVRDYAYIFAWSADDIPGISETIARHSLYVNPKARPLCQKKIVFSEEKWAAIDEELDRLLIAKFIEPVKFSTWIADVVLVKRTMGNDGYALIIQTSIWPAQKITIFSKISTNLSMPRQGTSYCRSWMPSLDTTRSKWISKIGSRQHSSHIEGFSDIAICHST